MTSGSKKMSQLFQFMHVKQNCKIENQPKF